MCTNSYLLLALGVSLGDGEETFTTPLAPKVGGASYYANARLSVSCMGAVVALPSRELVRCASFSRVLEKSAPMAIDRLRAPVNMKF